MTSLILIRHGETDWNVEGRWQGQIDIPLNQKGRIQAEETARNLSDVPISAIYSSDLSRAFETARPLADWKGLPIQTDPRLREIHQGVWQGMLVKDIQARYAERFEQRADNPLSVSPPGGETVLQVNGRVLSIISEIVQRHPQETIAIVSHGFVIALLQVHFENEPIEKVWQKIPHPGVWLKYEVHSTDL